MVRLNPYNITQGLRWIAFAFPQVILFVFVDAIGRYQILGEIGRGGMGVVYRALDSTLKRTVAIKTVRLPEGAPADAQDSLERLLREAQAAAMLSHPNIVTVHDLIEQGGMLYIVMELVDGESLAHVIDSGRKAARADSLRILRETADALDYAHARGVVHRDIKPANILIQFNGSSKITDFGIAKLSQAQGNARKLTAERLLVGTLEFMAPEQIRGEEVDGRADQYSLAVVAYQLLSGVLPHVAPSVVALAHRIVSESPGRLPGGSEVEQAALAKALSKFPSDRFPSCRAFVDSFSGAAPFPATATSGGSRRTYRAIAAGALLALCIAAGAYFAFNGGTPAPQPAQTETVVKPPPVAPPDKPAQVAVTQPLKQPEKEPLKEAPDKLIVDKPKEPPVSVQPPVAPVHESGAGAVRKNSLDGQPYVWIPAGTFQMGCATSDPDCRREENPPHKVTLTKGFWLGQTETTTGAYKRFASATGRPLPKSVSFNREWELDDQPMIKATWLDADAFCSWAGARLPSEAEWEYAARGGNPPAIYVTGDRISHDDANFGSEENEDKGAAEGKDRWQYTSPVGSFAANRFNLFDMTGNVGEWCNDWFSEDYYLGAPAKDPPGPVSGTMRVIRGGSWMSKKRFLRLSYRIGREPEHLSYSFGFRCAADRLK